jgi:hypothetical protein
MSQSYRGPLLGKCDSISSLCLEGKKEGRKEGRKKVESSIYFQGKPSRMAFSVNNISAPVGCVLDSLLICISFQFPSSHSPEVQYWFFVLGIFHFLNHVKSNKPPIPANRKEQLWASELICTGKTDQSSLQCLN